MSRQASAFTQQQCVGTRAVGAWASDVEALHELDYIFPLRGVSRLFVELEPIAC